MTTNTSSLTTVAISMWTCESQESPTANELLEYIITSGPNTMATMFVPLGLLLVMLVMYIDCIRFQMKHSVYWRRTAYIAWVLGIFPIPASLCLLGIFVPKSSTVTAFGVSFYFAIALKKFFDLILHYYGGNRRMEEALREDLVVASNPFPCCFVCCCRNQPMTASRINKLQATVYQVVLVYPIAFFIQLLLYTDEVPQRSRAGQIAIALVGLTIQASTLVCLYGYIIIGRSSRHALENFRIRGKTISVQLALACNSLQSFVINLIEIFGDLPCGFPYPNRQKSFLLHSYLLFCELFILFLGAWYLFRHSEEGCEVIVRTKNPVLRSISKSTEMVPISISEKPFHENEDRASIETYKEI